MALIARIRTLFTNSTPEDIPLWVKQLEERPRNLRSLGVPYDTLVAIGAQAAKQRNRAVLDNVVNACQIGEEQPSQTFAIEMIIYMARHSFFDQFVFDWLIENGYVPRNYEQESLLANIVQTLDEWYDMDREYHGEEAAKLWDRLSDYFTYLPWWGDGRAATEDPAKK